MQRDVADPSERTRLARLLQSELTQPAGFVLPLEPDDAEDSSRQRWRSSRWPLRREHLYLVPGDSPMGLRLPLDSLPTVPANGPAEWGAAGIDVDVPWSGGGTINASGNSFAAPVIAGHLARIVGAHPGITPWQARTVLAALAEHAAR